MAAITTARVKALAGAPSALPVLEHRLLSLRRTWRANVFSSFLLPVLFLLSLGVSVGGFVDRGGGLGVPYLDYLAPGLLASTAVQIAVVESMWPILGAFRWSRLYHAMRATPLRPGDIVAGEFAFLTLRVAIPATSFLLVMALFGVVRSWWAPAAVPVAVLVGMSLAGGVMAYSASITSANMFALLFRFAVVPMLLLAGVFFPVEALPLVVRVVAYVSPLWHGVELCRYATLGQHSALPALAHVGYLVVLALAGFALARARFARRLAD